MSSDQTTGSTAHLSADGVLSVTGAYDWTIDLGNKAVTVRALIREYLSDDAPPTGDWVILPRGHSLQIGRAMDDSRFLTVHADGQSDRVALDRVEVEDTYLSPSSVEVASTGAPSSVQPASSSAVLDSGQNTGPDTMPEYLTTDYAAVAVGSAPDTHRYVLRDDRIIGIAVRGRDDLWRTRAHAEDRLSDETYSSMVSAALALDRARAQDIGSTVTLSDGAQDRTPLYVHNNDRDGIAVALYPAGHGETFTPARIPSLRGGGKGDPITYSSRALDGIRHHIRPSTNGIGRVTIEDTTRPGTVVNANYADIGRWISAAILCSPMGRGPDDYVTGEGETFAGEPIPAGTLLRWDASAQTHYPSGMADDDDATATTEAGLTISRDVCPVDEDNHSAGIAILEIVTDAEYPDGVHGWTLYLYPQDLQADLWRVTTECVAVGIEREIAQHLTAVQVIERLAAAGWPEGDLDLARDAMAEIRPDGWDHPDLDAVAEGFAAAHLWTDAIPLDYDPEVGGSGGLQGLTAGPRLMAHARDICARFLSVAQADDIQAHMDAFGDPDGGDPGEYVGHTFYLDAARSGVSFTDRAWRDDDPMEEVCERLSAVAKTFGEVEFMEAAEQLDDDTADLPAPYNGEDG